MSEWMGARAVYNKAYQSTERRLHQNQSTSLHVSVGRIKHLNPARSVRTSIGRVKGLPLCTFCSVLSRRICTLLRRISWALCSLKTDTQGSSCHCKTQLRRRIEGLCNGSPFRESWKKGSERGQIGLWDLICARTSAFGSITVRMG